MEGEGLKVVGERDVDGFYRGEINGRVGLVPGNIVQEVKGGRERYYDRYDRYDTGLNGSDPLLAAPYRSDYLDYESDAAPPPPPPHPAFRPEDPRLRRLKWGAGKSYSYDYAERRRAVPPEPDYGPYDTYEPPPPRPSYYDDPYRSDLYAPPPQPYPLDYDFRGRNYYRGSLDRRTRDYSAPVRSPSQQDLMSERGRRFPSEGPMPPPHGPPPLPTGYYPPQPRQPPPPMPSYPRPYEYDYPPPPPTQPDQYPPAAPYGSTAGPSGYGMGGAGDRRPQDSYYPRDPRDEPEQERSARQPPGSFHGGGQDRLEQSIRDAVRDGPFRRMVAKYNYDPKTVSPNPNGDQVELTFYQGDVLNIYGEMDEDGFYIGELNKKRGLVPSNFLEPYNPSSGALPMPPTGSSRDSQPQHLIWAQGGRGGGRGELEPQDSLASELRDIDAELGIDDEPSKEESRGVKFVDDTERKGRAGAGAGGGVRKAGSAGGAAGPSKAAAPTAGPRGAMKKTDSTVGQKTASAKKASDAKASPAAPRKQSQAPGKAPAAKGPPKK